MPDWHLLGLFGVGAFCMRSVGCVINDYFDKDIDRHVSRTRSRPLASGKLSDMDALCVSAALLSVSLAVLLQLNLMSICVGASALALVAAYPLAKRYTHWPQLVLGFTFNWGAILGHTAATGSFSPTICLPLYAAGVCWTIVYDTIYAHQDKSDDLALGIGSTALLFGANTRRWLATFTTAMLTNLAIVGHFTDQTWPFYVATSAAGAHLFWQVGTVRIDDPDDCLRKFRANRFVGALIFAGILAANLAKTRTEAECIQQVQDPGQ